MNSLSLRNRAGVWLSGMVAALSLLAAGWLLAGAVGAQAGPAIDVQRVKDTLSASAVAAEGSEIDAESWKWMVTDICNLDLFSDFDSSENKKGSGWTTPLSAEDGGEVYCFYVEDSEGRSAVVGLTVAKPLLELEQNNDQLTARVSNAEDEGFEVNEDSWRWYRYNQADGISCSSEFFGLDGIGSGSSINLSDEDEGLNFCFGVSDTSGISNVGHITIGEVVIEDVEGKKTAVGITTDSQLSVNGAAGTPGASETDSTDGTLSDTSAGDNEDRDDDDNTVRNAGFVLLAASLALGIWMIIKRSQNTEEEA